MRPADVVCSPSIDHRLTTRPADTVRTGGSSVARIAASDA
jgi:hypothetical protein